MPATLRQLRSEQTRERLLDAAIALMDAKGHGQWSVHEVARAAGMTSGAVQHHFASKATLMLEVITRLIGQLEDSSGSDFWPPAHWPLPQRAEHFVQHAWARLYGQPRFAVAWSAYLAAREDTHMVAHIHAQRAQLATTLEQRMVQSFPELGHGPEAAARVQFVLSVLRGLGLAAPFSPPDTTAPQLRVLSDYLQSLPPLQPLQPLSPEEPTR